MINGTIRMAEDKDIDAIAELDQLCFATPWSREAYARELRANKLAFYIVADEDGVIVGFAGLWGIIEEGHITNVAVHPAYRNKGLGRQLVSRLLEVAEEYGIDKFTLEVRPSNESAITLYNKLGFKAVGRRPRYYEDNGEDALIMWRYRDEQRAREEALR